MTSSVSPASAAHTRPRKLWWILGIIASLVVVTIVVFAVSPWPSALIIRQVFQDGAKKVSAIMAPYAPEGVDSVLDVPYKEGSKFTTLDVFYPEGTTEPLGTVIWTHGGAWVSGNKSNDTVYFELLASHGFTVIGLNYTYGPEATYPTAVFELNDAHRFILDNADKFNVDPNRIVLAGDSAGSQLSSQLANIITNPAYAAEMNITPALSPDQLHGMVLNCGIYEMSTLLGQKGILGWGDDVALWAYTGSNDLENSVALDQMSSIDHVTKDFPATYISGGNADPLTDANSKPFAAKLESLGVPVTSLFWPSDYTPALPHEYQFRLDLDAAQEALTQTLGFLSERIGQPLAQS